MSCMGRRNHGSVSLLRARGGESGRGSLVRLGRERDLRRVVVLVESERVRDLG